MCKSIEFVVPNERLHLGLKALSQIRRITPCLRGEICSRNPQEQLIRPPAVHMHVDDSEVTVGLYSQSETLWFLPALDDSLLFPQKSTLPSYLVLASDQTVLPPWRPGRGSGVFEPTEHSVIVPQSIVLLEAFLRLYARDSAKGRGSLGMAMIAYMELYVDDDGFLNSNHLTQPLRKFYKELREGNKPVRQWGRELRKALGVPDEEPED